MKKFLWLWMLCVLCSVVSASPYFLIDSEEEWNEALYAGPGQNSVREAMPHEWEEFMIQRELYPADGDPVEPSLFLTPELYVYEGDPEDPNTPDDACLVMAWGDPGFPEDNYASGYVFEYGEDPDLRNCTLKVTVHPPAAIVMVAFGLTDIFGNQCSWTWYVPTNIPSSPPGQPTTIIINTNNIPALGVNSANPASANFSYNPGFKMNMVSSIFITETFHNTPGVYPPPTPGGGATYFYWNAWDNIVITPSTGGSSGGGEVNSKWYIKYSQPPDVIDDSDPPLINGWDEHSIYDPNQWSPYPPRMVADDWLCEDGR